MAKLIDLTGKVFGELTVIARAPDKVYKSGRSTAWLCRCSCGKETIVTTGNLRRIKSCGHLGNGHKREDLTGQVFGRLTVIAPGDDYIVPKTGVHSPMYLCRCECGNEVVVRASSLKRGESRSCGCLQKELARDRQRIHGGYGERLNYIWNSMVQRCCNENNRAYHSYGGRGITLCDEWRNDYAVFKEWAINNGYSDDLTLDRIDNNKGYFPENCRWVTIKEQARNKRTSINYTHDGETMCLSAWCEKLGLNYQTIHNRIRRLGWTFEEAITGIREQA